VVVLTLALALPYSGARLGLDCLACSCHTVGERANMSPNRRDNDKLAHKERTSPCQTSVLNLGSTPRLSASHIYDKERDELTALPDRDPRKWLPSQVQAMTLLSRAVVPEGRDDFVCRFGAAVEGGRKEDDVAICATPVRWLAQAYQCDVPYKLREASDMFPGSGIESEFLNEFYVMDVILNRSLSPADEDDEGVVDPDVVVMSRAYEPDDLDDANDFKYRTMAVFLPQCGVFYCARERRREDVGLARTLIPLDMSWLRLERRECSDGSVSYTFGSDGYVKRFHVQHASEKCYESREVSAWRISTRRRRDGRSDRFVWRVAQCHDKDGPMMAPDVFSGEDAIAWPHEYLAAEYNRRLASAGSAKRHGRHYADGCHHYRIPHTCWVIDPTVMHCVDIMVDVATVGRCVDRQSVVMIRHVLRMDTDDGDRDGELKVEGRRRTPGVNLELSEALSRITAHNALVRRRVGTGGARSKSRDVGAMHAIGTRVDFDNVTTMPYHTNACVFDRVLRDMVVGLWKVGNYCFPQVLAVIRDLERDSGLKPIPPMDGLGERGRGVGFTIDMSVNLGNASHYDVHDASQGFSVWTEEVFGLGSNWYFVMPNLHGKRPDGRAFRGVAVKLSYGIAISWDGRVIRHATSLSKPDGIVGGRVGDAGYVPRNNLFGTFTAAKERVIKAGRALCAASAAEKAASGSDDRGVDDVVAGTGGDAPRSGRKRRKRRRKKSRVTVLRDGDNVNETLAGPVVRMEKNCGALLSPRNGCDENGMVSLENRIPRKKPRSR
jgi:hypothetical protein